MAELEDVFEELPPFANETNKKLDGELRASERKLLSLTYEVEDNHARIGVMLEHLKNVRAELVASESVLVARNKETETEDHMKRLAERETGRLNVELRRAGGRIRELKDQINRTKNAIFQGEKKVEAIRDQMNWDQDELDQWLVASRQKEEDSLLLKKYAKMDDAKVRDLTLKVQKQAKAVGEKKKALELEVTETRAAQIELDKTAEAFRGLHGERQRLIVQLEDALEAVKARDGSLETVSSHIADVAVAIRLKEVSVREKKEFHSAEVANNAALRKEMEAVDRDVGRLRETILGSRSAITELDDQAETLKATVTGTANELFAKKTEVASLTATLDNGQSLIAERKMARDAAKVRLEQSSLETLSMEDRVAAIEANHVAEEARLEEMDRALQGQKDSIFREAQKLFKLREAEANYIAEIQGAQAAKKTLLASINKLDAQSLKQQELIYNQEFQLQQLERKVSRAQGERSDEEKIELNARIAELQEELDQQNEVMSLLQTQLKKAENDARRGKRELEKGAADAASITTHIEELQLENASAERIVRAAVERKEELMVQVNLLKLDVKKMGQILEARGDEVFGLENRKEQLRLSMLERMAEIKAETDTLRARAKVAEEERHRAKLELRDRMVRIDKLSSKYEILSTKFAVAPGEEERSQAFYVIKAAQEREELLREGDAINAKIATAEADIAALETTMKALAASNSKFQSSLRKVDTSSPEYEEKVAKEDQFRAIVDTYKRKRRQIRDMEDELASLQDTLAQWRATQSAMVAEYQSASQELSSYDAVFDQQAAQESRAIQSMTSAAKDHRAGEGLAPDQQSLYERDFLLRELKGFNDGLLGHLKSLASAAPASIGDLIESELVDAGITLPPGPADPIRNPLDRTRRTPRKSVGSRSGSRSASRSSSVGSTGSRSRSRGGSRSGSRSGSRTGSRAGSRSGSRTGSRRSSISSNASDVSNSSVSVVDIKL